MLAKREGSGYEKDRDCAQAQNQGDIAAYIARFGLKSFPIPSTGEQGNNFTLYVPRIIKLDQRYLLKSLRDCQNGTRKNQSMVYVVRNLTDADLAEMAAYYAGQKEGLTTLE